MKQRIIDIYKYSELSETAKEKARDWYREASQGDNFYAECVIDDAKEVASLFGLDIDKIYYSGFWSQGDGASFTGFYQYKKGALQSVKSYAPKDVELLNIVEQLQEIQRKSFYGISCKIRQSGYYQHEMTMQFDIDIERQSYDCVEDDLAETLRDYARWVYKRLEESYDFENSDEHIEENIEANEYEFLESGERA